MGYQAEHHTFAAAAKSLYSYVRGSREERCRGEGFVSIAEGDIIIGKWWEWGVSSYC